MEKIICIDIEHNCMVELMAISGNYAMVRRKGCAPFIRAVDEIRFANKKYVDEMKKHYEHLGADE